MTGLMSEGETAVYRAECTCGWELDRDARAANLPRENNERIAEAATSAHQFAHDVFEPDGHQTTRGWA